MTQRMPMSRVPDLVGDMLDALSRAFQAHGKPQNEAEHDADVAVNALIEAFGGEMLYLPIATLRLVDEKNRRIQQEFSGSNHRELARKYGHSIQHIYRIVKRKGDAPQ